MSKYTIGATISTDADANGNANTISANGISITNSILTHTYI